MAERLTQVETETVEVKVQAAIAEEQATLAHKRIDQLDTIDPNGEPRQQLVVLVNKYAQRNGLQYNQAWNDFRQAYNIAFRTNLKLRMKYYAESHQMKRITVPEYLQVTGHIEDGLRVANKLLSPSRSLTVV